MGPCGERRSFILFVAALLVWGSVAQAQVQAPAPEGLTRGHRVLLKWGLQVQGHVHFPDTVPMTQFDLETWKDARFTSIDPLALYPVGLLPGPPGMPWSRITSKYPTQLEASELPYVPNLIRISMGDEQNITDPDQLAGMRAQINSFHQLYPEVIVHTNQGATQHTAVQIRNYMRDVQPDMLMFDYYPWGEVGPGTETLGGSPTLYYQELEMFRKLGLEGNDGTGAHPIPTGLWTQVYIRPNITRHVPSESELRLNHFSAWAFGYKLTNAFFYNHRGNNFKPLMFEDDGWTYDENAARTPQFDQVAETNRQSVNLGPALVRMISTDLRMEMGRHMGAGAVPNTLPQGVARWDLTADPYMKNITAANRGSRNNGLRGDVIVGYFRPLDPSFTNAGHEDDIYFMIVNGLTDPTGSAAETAQFIRLDFDFGASDIDSLLRLSRDTGQVEEVALTSDGGTRYHLDLTLDGGTGDLFKFDNGGMFVPEPTSLSLLIGSGLMIGGRAVAASQDRQPSNAPCGREMTEEIRGKASQQSTDRR